MNGILLLMFASQMSLQPLTEKLESAEYLTGSFVQTDYWALTLDSQVSHGTLHLAHPNLFLLDYSDSENRMTGSTGTEVFTVDSDFMEILVYSGSPTGFLHILSSAADDDACSPAVVSGDSVTVTLTGSFDGGIQEITAGYTSSDSLPFLLSTVDSNGNSTTWEISSLSIMDHVPEPGIFTIPDIPGFSIVDAGTI